MNVDTNNLVSIADASRDFSKVTRMVDRNGAVVIIKNDAPRYILLEYGTAEKEQIVDDDDLFAASKRLIEKNREAYEALAK